MAFKAPTSKWKHVYPEVARPDQIYKDIKPSATIWDCSNFLAANTKFFAIAWQAAGGGKIAVLPHSQVGKMNPNPPTIAGHTAPILDWDFHPFNDHLLATGSEDLTVRLWSIPPEGLTENITESVQTLTGHSKKVGILKFHPSADHVLATAAIDHTIKIWDVEKGAAKYNVDVHKDQIFSVDWNLDGSLLVTANKEKKVRIVDPRGNTVVAAADAHGGAKAQKAYWAKHRNQILTVGSSKTLERQVMIWDPRSFNAPIYTHELDNQSGVLMAFIDEDTGMVYVGGKGDGNIRFFELWDNAPIFNPIGEYPSTAPQKGLCFLPKLAMNVKKCEVARCLKLENTQVTPISFICPRKQAEVAFQDDVYVDTFAPFPAIPADAYFSGTNAAPQRVSMDPTQGSPTSPASGSFSPVKQKKPSPELLAQREKVARLRKELADAEAKLASLGGATPAPAAPAAPAAPKAGGPPPPPPPPPPPAPPVLEAADAKPAGSTAALFSQIQGAGDNITSGLRKVTDDMKVYKQQREEGYSLIKAEAAPAAPKATPAAPKKEQKGTPRLELVDDKKWHVEWQEGTRAESKTIELNEVAQNHAVYIYHSEFCSITIGGKVNSITLVDCKKVDLLFQDTIATVEVTNSKNINLQVTGKFPSCNVDKSNDVMIFLSKQSLETSILSSTSTGLNVTLPPPTEGADPIELPVPDQFVTRIQGRQLVTRPTEHV
eukprot:TRINITY_DN677_c0_g1_i1.p1 TRINITY_DN677_c0_g1~~TRINITY_DN677_c0_g1_i1.p1  ORF type:complete len:722 (-),score=181.97 TRINITY_DN677_c0_g1_i1:138-2282(-)